MKMDLDLSMLFGLSMLSFGTHLSRSSMSILLVFMVADGSITPFGYACLCGANSLPALFVPFFSGRLLDKYGYWPVTTSYLTMSLFGQFLFAIAISCDIFWLQFLGQIIFGAGGCCVVVAQRSLISSRSSKYASFATGSYVSIACTAKLIGKAVTAPLALWFGTYKCTPYFCALVCLCSLVLGVMTWCKDCETEDKNNASKNRDSMQTILESNENERESLVVTETETTSLINKSEMDTYGMTSSQEPGESSSSSSSSSSSRFIDDTNSHDSFSYGEYLCRLLKEKGVAWQFEDMWYLPYEFWSIILAHGLYILVFHTFANFLPHYMVEKYGNNVIDAGIIASISAFASIVIAPSIGFFADRFGRFLPCCLAASIGASVAYYLLLFSNLLPLIPISIMALSQAVIPTILLTTLPLFMPSRMFGLGFGIVEISDAAVNIIGNLLFGKLHEINGSYNIGLYYLYLASIGGIVLFSTLILLAYIWKRIDMFDETIAVYSSPVPRTSFSQYHKDKERRDSASGVGTPLELGTSPRRAQPRRGSKELLGLSDEDRRHYTYMTMQCIDNDAVAIAATTTEEGISSSIGKS